MRDNAGLDLDNGNTVKRKEIYLKRNKQISKQRNREEPEIS